MLSLLLAASIAFTNTSGDCDLSKAENWDGSALPGAADVGVVDVATYGGAYTVGADAEIGGLSFTSASSKVTIGGEGTLTLGAGGLTLDAAGGLAVNAPLATSADQTWDFGAGEVTFSNTIGGTADLTLQNASLSTILSGVSFRAAPNYGGRIINKCRLYYYDAGAFCKSLKSESQVYFMITGAVEVAFSKLFSGGSYTNTVWDPNTEWVKRPRTELASADAKNCAGLLLDAGILRPGGIGFSMDSGWIRQTGGTFDVSGGWGLFVGDYSASKHDSYSWDTQPAAYYLEGGEIVGRQIFLGMYYGYGAKPALVHQTGGTANLARVCIGAGNQSKGHTFSRYLMGGGTLEVGYRTDTERGLIVSALGSQGGNQSGEFVQTNGTVRAWRLLWGSDAHDLGVATETDLGFRYGEFALEGGRFELGDGGIARAANWCRSTTNCAYVMRMSGGTFAPQSTIGSSRFQWLLMPSGKDFTVETKKQFNQLAPICGQGTLRKTGSGMLVLSDATRFTGSIKVDEGRLAFTTVTPTTTDDEGAIIWSGDDIATKAGLADGEGVENLTSTDGNHTFVRMDAPEGSTVVITETVAISSDSAFAGHKSMLLNYNLLQMAADQNPLNGATNFTVALVYRSSKGDWTTSENASYSWQYAAGILGNCGDCAFTQTHTRQDNYSSQPRFAFGAAMNGSQQMMSEMDYNMNDNKAHVAIVSYSNNFVRVIVDGFTTNYLVAGATSLARFRNKPIYLGGLKGTSYTHVNQIATATYLAELRMYPARAMTEPECYALGATLANTYGVNADGVVRFSTKCGSLVAPTTPATPAETAYEWDADDVAATHDDGAEVTSWATKDGTTATATKAETSSHVQNGPTLVKNAINGHAALKFTRALKTALGVAGASNPILGQNNATLAVVFRSADTNLTGNGAYGCQYEGQSGDGIFGTRTYGWNPEDMGFTFHRYGSILAAWGCSRYSYTLRPMHLNDNQPHIAILSRNGSDGKYELMVDGVTSASGSTTCPALLSDAKPLLFGLSQNEANWGWFEGEIAAARAYARALTHDEMKAMCDYYAAKYGFLCLGQLPVQQVTTVGLAATNITVASGATLTLPYNTTAPYTIASGVSISGEGRVEGVLRYGAGSLLDLNATLPSFDNVQLQSCTVKAALQPVDGSAISSMSGTITIDPTLFKAAGKRRGTMLTNVAPTVIAEGTTFVITDALSTDYRAEYKAATQSIVIRPFYAGLKVIVR